MAKNLHKFSYPCPLACQGKVHLCMRLLERTQALLHVFSLCVHVCKGFLERKRSCVYNHKRPVLVRHILLNDCTTLTVYVVFMYIYNVCTLHAFYEIKKRKEKTLF